MEHDADRHTLRNSELQTALELLGQSQENCRRLEATQQVLQRRMGLQTIALFITALVAVIATAMDSTMGRTGRMLPWMPFAH
jgi:hypothetical protein